MPPYYVHSIYSEENDTVLSGNLVSFTAEVEKGRQGCWEVRHLSINYSSMPPI